MIPTGRTRQMTIRAPTRRPVLGESMPSPRPFGVVDELNCYFDAPAEPNNVHVETWLPGHLDPGRLRDAVTAALAAEPRAGVRRAPGGWWRRRFYWEPPAREAVDPVATDPVTTAAWETESDLDESRERFMAAAPPLDRSPPFRLLLARGPGRDSLILNAHHAAFDGRSCLRLLQLIAERYDATGLPAVPAGEPFQTRIPRPAKTGSPGQARHPVRRNSRIAPRHADGHRTRRAPGYGFALLGWPGVPAVPAAGAGEPRVTVNDLLIAALIEAVREWNAAARRAPGRVLISMPVDAREPGRG